MGLRNLVVHVDWNQASIDSNRVCRDGDAPGEYVQWDPAEFAYLHDWNVILVPDGKDYRQIVAAQRHALALDNGQPTAIVYRTIKGWQDGIEGRASHGAGHKLCAAGFYDALEPLIQARMTALPKCDGSHQRCGGCDEAVIEQCYWEALLAVRGLLQDSRAAVESLADWLAAARSRLASRRRTPRTGAPVIDAVYKLTASQGLEPPAALALAPGTQATLRGALGDVLNHLNHASHGGLLVASADLAGSTSVSNATRGFKDGYFHAADNPDARLLSVGGICEDAAAGMLAGLSTYGWHIGVGSSYAAFLAPLGHIAARLHAIGSQARRAQSPGEPYKPFILVCAHAGLKTGEDGPTHADPQALQLLQENFPRGTMVTLTPWDPQEVWPAMMAALGERPAIIAPFVTRPAEAVIDRHARGLAPAAAAAKGVYALRAADPAPARRHDRAAGKRRRLRVRGGRAAAHRPGGPEPADHVRRVGRALRPAAGRRAVTHLPARLRGRSDGHHGLHAADVVPVDPVAARTDVLPASVHEGALPGQRPGRRRAEGGRPRRTESVRRNCAVRQSPVVGPVTRRARVAPIAIDNAAAATNITARAGASGGANAGRRDVRAPVPPSR